METVGGAVADLPHQGLRLGDALRVAQRLEVQRGTCRIIGDAGRHEVIGGRFAQTQNLPGDGLAVIGELDRLAQPQVLKRLAREIDREVGDPKIGVQLQGASNALPHPDDLGARHEVLGV